MHIIRFFCAAVAAIAIPCAAGSLEAVCTGTPKYHTEVISSGTAGYSIKMGGRIDGQMTRDPVGYWAYDQFWEPNLYVRMENIGDEPVVNPWLLRAGKPDTRTLKSIVDSVITPSMSDAEKARRLWEFEIKQRFHATTSDEEVDDAIKRFNVYGYTLCGNESKIISDLWRTAGLKTRKGYPNGHSTAEVFYDGAFHLLDSDESIICLLRDNKTIASEEQIVADHDLMKRTHTYGPLHDDDAMRDESSVALHFYEGERAGEQPSLTRHTMDFTLRPGESISWAWNPANRFHGKVYEDPVSNAAWIRRWRLLAHAMNGEMEYAPDFTKAANLKYVQLENTVLRETGPFGAGLYVNGRSGSVTIPMKSAYPVVGGRLEADFNRRDIQKEHIRVSFSFDSGKSWRNVATNWPSDYARMYVDLDPVFPAGDPARYEYLVRFDLVSEAEQPTVCLKGFRLKSTLQMARLAMPALSLGDNSFTYTDQSGPGRKVRITHAWRECDGAAIPEAPAAAIYPAEGGVADGTRVAFRWQPVATAADYEFQLSEYADMRWALSPNFHKLIARTANRNTAAYDLPYPGLLNPGETYHWRVRARTADGVWGPWSKTFAFKADAPAVPMNVAARFDKAARTATLAWTPGQGGSQAVRFRVYGSAERGFTANDKPYKYDAGLDGMKDAPANLLLEVKGTSAQLPPELWRAYYRVVALDEKGRTSGLSGLAELPRPLIATRQLPPARPGEFYETRVAVATSIGHLVSQDYQGKPYHVKFRGGDELVFELTGAPEGLAIGKTDGVISGFVPAGTGTTKVTVTVTNHVTGERDSVVLPFGVAASGPVQRRSPVSR
jgi:hypothetical protein